MGAMATGASSQLRLSAASCPSKATRVIRRKRASRRSCGLRLLGGYSAGYRSSSDMPRDGGECDGTRAGRAAVTAAALPSTGDVATDADLTGKILINDNYDSFTFNLVQYVAECGADYVVYPNDFRTVEEIKAMRPKAVLISPGPGCPEESGISLDVISLGVELGIPVFGVCMGHQCIGQYFGGDVIRHPDGVMHGKMSLCYHTGEGVLAGMPNPFKAARYHSLVIDKETCPNDLEVTAWCEDGTIMAVRHKKYKNIEGVQFHPESVLTEGGMTIVKNWVDMVNNSCTASV